MTFLRSTSVYVKCTYAVEPPYTERYVRWCERSATLLMGSLLLDLITNICSHIIFYKQTNVLVDEGMNMPVKYLGLSREFMRIKVGRLQSDAYKSKAFVLTNLRQTIFYLARNAHSSNLGYCLL